MDYVLQTYSITSNVWGGARVYEALGAKDAIFKAFNNLVSNYYDTKAAIIVTVETTKETPTGIFLVFYFYNSSTGPGEILDEFLGIPGALLDTTGLQSYPGIVGTTWQLREYIEC